MSDNEETLRVRISAEGVPELSNGMNLAGAAVDKLAQKLPAASAVLGRFGGGLATVGDGFGASAVRAALAAGPIGVMLGLVAGGVAIHELAAREGQAYARAIDMTNNAAGTYVSEMASMARATSQLIGTQGQAAEALAALAGTGEVMRANLQGVAQVTLGIERTLGEPLDRIVSKFASLGEAPLQASLKLNRGLNYLTAATYDQIRALMAEGKEREAGAVAQQAYAAAMQERVNKVEAQLGLLQRAWRGVGDVAKTAWDIMLDIGRPSTLDQKMSETKAKIDSMRRIIGQDGGGLLGMWAQGRIKDLQQEQAALNRTMLNQAEQAMNSAEVIAAQQKELRDRERASVEASLALETAQAKAAATQRESQAALELARTQAAISRRQSLLSAEQATLADVRERDSVSMADYYNRRANLERGALALEIENVDAEISAARKRTAARLQAVDQQMAAESRRAPNDDNELAKQQARMIELAGQRTAAETDGEARVIELRSQRARLTAQQIEAGIAGERALMNASATAAERYLDDVERRRQAVVQLNDQQRQANAAAAVNLIADPYTRAAARARLDIDELNRYYDQQLSGLRARQQGLQYSDPDQAAAVLQEIRTAEDQKAQAIVLRTKQLTEELKPEWQRQLDSYRDHTRLMRESYDDFNNSWLQSGQQAWSDYMRTGKLSISGIAETARVELGNVLFKQVIAEPFSKIGQQLAGAFGLGGGADAALKVTGQAAETSARSLNTAAVTAGTTAMANLATTANAAAAAMASVAGQSGSSTMGLIGQLLGAAAGGGGTIDVNGYGMTPGDGSVALPTRGGLATGGNARAGSMYEVNERGPELLTVNNRTYLMMGGKDGYVTPNGGGGGGRQGGGGSSIIFAPQIHIDSRTDRAEVARIISAAMEQAQAQLVDKMARGMV